MTITVAGILPDPMGNPMEDAIVRVTTLESEYTPSGSVAQIQLEDAGNYSFTLEEGSYRIDIHQYNRFTEGEDVLVDDSLTGSIELPDLMKNYQLQE